MKCTEIILAEIDRMMAEEMAIFEDACRDGDCERSSAPVAYTRLQMLHQFIDSLQKEPAEEQEPDNSCNNGKNLQKCPTGEDLEEEIVRYVGYPQEVDEDVSTTMIRKAARHFASWQEKQMMKDAFVFEYKHNYACALASECLRNHGWFNKESDFNDFWRFVSGVNKLFEGEFMAGDKVKLIIIKQED